MHQNFTYTDLADRYLKGKLSEGERLAFEEKMRQDPLLANEMSLQKDIYQALGETRRIALKNRLNQVPIDHSPWTPWQGFKTAAVVGTLLLAGASYYYFDSSDEPSKATAIDTPASTSESVVSPKTYTFIPDRASEDVVPDSDAQATVEAVDQSKEEVAPVTPSLSPRTTRPPSRRATPTIVRPEVVSEFDEDETSVDYYDFRVPEKQLLQTNDHQQEDVAIEALSDSGYDFHYQFYDNKLYLHGDFHSSPYKIIALNTETNKKLFLEFDNAYYRIEKHRKAVPLIEIKDSALVKSLKNLSRID